MTNEILFICDDLSGEKRPVGKTDNGCVSQSRPIIRIRLACGDDPVTDIKREIFLLHNHKRPDKYISVPIGKDRHSRVCARSLLFGTLVDLHGGGGLKEG